MKAVPTSRICVFILLVCAGCAADLVTKKWMFPDISVPYEDNRPDWLWNNVVAFQTSLNEGALFGLGQGFVPLFALLSIFAAVGIMIWLFYGGAAHDWHLTIALGCVTAGIFGNLYDRLGLPGLIWNGPNGPDRFHLPGEPVYAVRDYILVMIGPWRWPNFNVADSLLVCGAIILFWQVLRTNRETKPVEKAAAEQIFEENSTKSP
jgi:signal peptidase II